jgi:NADH-quinone oxidoreductase subunit K
MTMTGYLLFSAALFCTGIYGALTRRSAIGVLLGVELMANAVNVSFATFARYSGSVHTQLFAVFVMALTVAEVAVGLALVILLYRAVSHTNIDETRSLRH